MPDLGFPYELRYHFRINGRSARLDNDGADVLSLLTELYHANLTCGDIYWALGWREQIRRVEQLAGRAVLTRLIVKTPDARLRLLAKQSSPRPLEDRSSNALANFQLITPATQRNGLWQYPGLRLYLTPPKTVEVIRRLLTRIAYAFSGSKA